MYVFLMEILQQVYDNLQPSQFRSCLQPQLTTYVGASFRGHFQGFQCRSSDLRPTTPTTSVSPVLRYNQLEVTYLSKEFFRAGFHAAGGISLMRHPGGCSALFLLLFAVSTLAYTPAAEPAKGAFDCASMYQSSLAIR